MFKNVTFVYLFFTPLQWFSLSRRFKYPDFSKFFMQLLLIKKVPVWTDHGAHTREGKKYFKTWFLIVNSCKSDTCQFTRTKLGWESFWIIQLKTIYLVPNLLLWEEKLMKPFIPVSYVMLQDGCLFALFIIIYILFFYFLYKL